MLSRYSRPYIATAIAFGLALALGAVVLLIQQSSVEIKIPFYTDTRSHRAVSCPTNPIVIVTFGQSLSANSGEHIYERIPNKGLYQYYNGQCFELADPVIGATGSGGSIWIPAASRLADVTNRPVVVVAGGVGGSTIAQWIAHRSKLADPLLARISDATRSGLVPDVFVWIQGEADTESRTSADVYRESLVRLHSLFNGAPWLITSNSICMNTLSRSPALDPARREFAKSSTDVFIGVDLDNLGLEYRASDRCHFNRQGQETAGRLVADAIANILKK